ncbi:MAG: hypothetical protein HZA10_03055 [Nitrospirae bacterium]|nr:hypothetical protein [Nitrospirota bacterium]
METSEIITLIVSSIGGSAALFTAVAWLARSLIKNFIDRDLEKFKLNLEKMAFEHQIRFSKLHEIRAQIIAELYGRLYEFHWAVCAFLRDFHKENKNDKTHRVQEIDKKSYEFKDYFDKHRIYFTENICSKVDELVDALYSAYVPLEVTDSDDDNLIKVWGKCADTVRKQYPAIRSSLESDFRKILGVIEQGIGVTH